MPSTTTKILSLLTLALTATARTDLVGCTSSKTVAYGGASILWYVPGTGEICAPLDCGGGRAPPKTTVPGCAAYSGTATYSPSFIPNFGVATATTASSVATASIGSWTSSVVAATGTASGHVSMKTSSMASTTAAAVLSSGSAAGTGGIAFDTSAVNGTTLSHGATLTAAAGSASASSSARPSSGAGVVGFGRDAVLMVAGAVVGVALL